MGVGSGWMVGWACGWVYVAGMGIVGGGVWLAGLSTLLDEW